jgi:hypothetical protein
MCKEKLLNSSVQVNLIPSSPPLPVSDNEDSELSDTEIDTSLPLFSPRGDIHVADVNSGRYPEEWKQFHFQVRSRQYLTLQLFSNWFLQILVPTRDQREKLLSWESNGKPPLPQRVLSFIARHIRIKANSIRVMSKEEKRTIVARKQKGALENSFVLGLRLQAFAKLEEEEKKERKGTKKGKKKGSTSGASDMRRYLKRK